jgi:tight adherence protein B
MNIPLEVAAAIPALAVAGGIVLLFAGLSRPAPASRVPWSRRISEAVSPLAERIERRREARSFLLGAETRLGTAERLERADLSVRPLEYHAIQLGLAAVMGGLGLLRFGFGLQAILLLAAGLVAPEVFLLLRQNRRQHAFEQELPGVLELLANGLRAGHSFLQASETVARSMKPPASVEFARAARQMALGGSIEDALESLRRRIPSPDLDLMVTAVVVHHSIGGNLAQILEGLNETMTERTRLKGEIQVLTAQARASGLLISLLPIVVAAFLYIVTPAYFRPMTMTALGWGLIALAATGIVVGNLIIRRINALEGI